MQLIFSTLNVFHNFMYS